MRPRALAVLLAAALVAVAAGGGALMLSREQASAAEPRAASVREIRALMEQRLRDRHLNFRYVACVRNGRTYEGVPVTRCNVNFNAPHIEVYCAVARGDTVATDHEDRTIPCPRDRVGRDPPIKVSGG